MRKLLFILMLLSTVYLSADEKVVGLVYNRATGVNRHALQFIMAKGSKLARGYTFQAVDVSRAINPAEYDALILVNTGVSSGVDPDLESFLNTVSQKNRVILLNLYQGRHQEDINYRPAGENNSEVDTITSASLWGGRSVKAMHQSWLQKIIDLISQF